MFPFASLIVAMLFWTSLDDKTSAQTEPDSHPNPNPIVAISIADRIFHLPDIYISPRPPLETLKPINYSKRFGIAFWMPDGSPVNDDPAWKPDFRPHKAGEIPSTDHFIVQINSITSASDIDAYPDPSIQLKNILNTGTDYWRVTALDDRTKLIETKEKNPKQFHYYYGDTEGGDRYLIRWLHNEQDINPGCGGFLRIYKYNLDTHIMIPKDQQRNMNTISAKVRMLLSGWAD